MLARANRLQKNRDVQRVLHKGTRLHASGLRLSYQISRRATPRFTVVISAKTLKHATDRNRLKRQIRASLRQFATQYPKAPLDVVVTVTKSDAVTIINEIEQLLAGILKKYRNEV